MTLLSSIGSNTRIFWIQYIATFQSPCQTIITFCVLLTKSDVRQHIVDLVTLSYLNCSCATKANGTNDVKDPAKTSPNVPQSEEPVWNNTGISESTVYGTAREALGSGMVESQVSNDKMVARDSQEDSESTDEVCDKETGVGQ